MALTPTEVAGILTMMFLSTIVNLLSERLGFKVMPEEFRDQHDLLSRFHHDRKWAFPMQLNFLVTRFAQYL